MSNSEGAFSVLRQSSDLACASAIEQAVSEASDRDLCRVNPIAFAAKRGLDEEKTIAAFLHASRLGIFELSWNVLCPGCGGVLEAGTTLKTINRDNVAQLTGVWRTRLRGSGTGPQYSGFAQPLVHDGVAYVSTGANDVFALSIDTGAILWEYTAKLDPAITSVCCGWNNKGVALSDDEVFIGQLDGKLVALDRATGHVAWSIQAERWQDNFSITSAPAKPVITRPLTYTGADVIEKLSCHRSA